MGEPCLPSLPGDVVERYALGFYAGGCYKLMKKPGCFRVGNTRYQLSPPELAIYDGEGAGDGIYLNVPVHDGFIHRFMMGGKSRSSYITMRRIDPIVFIGLFQCRYSYTREELRAFNETMDLLSINPGNPVSALRLKAEAYDAMVRLTESLERVISKPGVFVNIAKPVIILGYRIGDDMVLFSEIHRVEQALIASHIEISRTLLHPEFSGLDRNSAFICGSPGGLSGYVGVKEIGGMECVVGDDPVRLVILLEKNITGKGG